MRCDPTTITEVIRAVELYHLEEAKKRIDFPTRPGTTFFSGQDIWLYDARYDIKTCPVCLGYVELASSMGGINGNYLRSLFPYLTILDEDTIGGPGNGGDGLSHPNCRCRMTRYVGDPDEALLAQKAVTGKYDKEEMKV